MVFIFTNDFAGNFHKGEIVPVERKDNGFLVNGVALVPEEILMQYGHFGEENDEKEAPQDMYLEDFFKTCNPTRGSFGEFLLSGIALRFPEVFDMAHKKYLETIKSQSLSDAVRYLLYVLKEQCHVLISEEQFNALVSTENGAKSAAGSETGSLFTESDWDKLYKCLHNDDVNNANPGDQPMHIGMFLQHCDLSLGDFGDILLSGISCCFPNEYDTAYTEYVNLLKDQTYAKAVSYLLCVLQHPCHVTLQVLKEDIWRGKIEKMVGTLSTEEWELMKKDWQEFTRHPERYVDTNVRDMVLQWLADVRSRN